MSCRPLILITIGALLGLACGDDTIDGTAGSTGGDATGDATAAATTDASAGSTSAATSGSDSATTTGSGSGTATDTTTTTTTTTADATSEGSSSDTSGGPLCDLEATACAFAEGGGPFVECGIVDPWNNTAAQWEDARACALAAFEAEEPFKLITWLQGIDSDVGFAYVGFQGETYGLIRFYYDSYPPEWLSQTSCAALVATEGCTVAPGEPCLSCEDSSPQTLLCGGP